MKLFRVEQKELMNLELIEQLQNTTRHKFY